MVDMPTIPGVGEGTFAGAANTFNTLINVFKYVLVIAGIGGFIILIVWMIRKVTSYNIPVTLKFRTGNGGILQARDKIKIVRHGDQPEVKFKKYWKLKAKIPDDRCAFFTNKGMKTVKTFEGLVDNDQVAWAIPEPQSRFTIASGQRQKLNEEGLPAIDNEGKPVMETEYQDIETFITAPTNMTEHLAAETRRNEELRAKKLGFFQNPVMLTWGAIMLVIVGFIFLYMLYKNVPDQINAYLAFAKTVAANCPGVQIK